MIRKYSLKLALWILAKFNVEYILLPREDLLMIPYEVMDAMPEAERVIKETERIPGTISGEYRFAVALGNLMARKRKTALTKRQAALAIELAIHNGCI